MFNLVLEVTDDGEPALTRYAQVIVTVNKEAEPVEEPEETEPKPLTREDILAIADSVGPQARHTA